MVGMCNFLMNMIYFVTDCDGTVCHYDVEGDELKSAHFSLPPSAGSGRVALTSNKTIQLMESISEISALQMICVSGMREATMMQRYKYFPFIKYWICENGGRIFEVNGNELIEISEWKSRFETDSALSLELSNFSQYLRHVGHKVDDGYLTMRRIKATNYADILPLIPSSLKYTYNLGYLDIHVPYSGKLPAVKWLLSHLQKRNNLQVEAMIENPEQSFYFMGDDDNDIEIANDSRRAYIVRPFSAKMREFLREKGFSDVDNKSLHFNGDHDLHSNKENSVVISEESSLMLESIPHYRYGKITVAHRSKFAATEDLLTLVIRDIKRT